MKISKKIMSACFMVLVLTFFIYGVIVGRYQIFPYQYISLLKNKFNPSTDIQQFMEPLLVDSELSSLRDQNIFNLIRLNSSQEVARLRQILIKEIWQSKALPGSTHYEVKPGVSAYDKSNDTTGALRKVIGSAQTITISMEYGFSSAASHFKPKEPNGKAVIFHHGHGHTGYDVISTFLKEGFSVISLEMPNLGANRKDRTIYIPRFGAIEINERSPPHDLFQFLETDNFSPIKLFLHPVLAVTQFLEDHGYEDISMVGISGGGWTTVFYAALDERIKNSWSIAGTAPMFTRSEYYGSWGDWESYQSSIYKHTNYLELYTLASYGLV